MVRRVRETLHPAWYHGHGEKPPFFEGWYFKIVDATEQHRFAFIPGIILSGEQPHAFVQVLNGTTGATTYHEFPTELFWAAENRFDVHIGPNRFATDTLSLLIDSAEQRLSGVLRFGGMVPWPVRPWAPGIMGWYAWVPLMECYHGVLSLDHNIYGELTIDSETIDFTGGRGYMEKDWGQSFPSAYVWMQSNHFGEAGTSFTGSIAMIPWVRQAFRGFIVGLWHEGQLYRFATYTGAQTEQLAVHDHTVQWVISDKHHRLQIVATRDESSKSGFLKGPDTQEMGKRIAEAMTARINIDLRERRSGRVIFAGNGQHAGLEVYNVEEGLIEAS